MGANTFEPTGRSTAWTLALAQVSNPLTLLLAFSALVSLAIGAFSDAVIILTILVIGGAMGFWQEYASSRAAAALLKRVPLTVRVLRDGKLETLPVSQVVPGDVFLVRAGDLVPADARVLEADSLFAVEAALSGEPFPAAKSVDPVPAEAALAARSSALWAGTSVRSGTGKAVAVATGRRTVFGGVAASLERREAETAFAAGLRRFGMLISQSMLAIVLAVYLINVLDGKPFMDSLSFALALAIGLTPEMLPAILGSALARGAKRLSADGAIVRRLAAVENLGAMDVLCTDKTGTLTTGQVRLERAVSPDGEDDLRVLSLAAMNSRLQAGLDNALDAAVLNQARERGIVAGSEEKIGEIPYDFVRRRVSVIVSSAGGVRMVTKGAPREVLSICSTVGAAVPPLVAGWQSDGYRVLAVAERVPGRTPVEVADEREMRLAGFLLFRDPPRSDARDTVARLEAAGIRVKMITGDNLNTAIHVARDVGLDQGEPITGAEIARLGSDPLALVARDRTVFAEVDPAGKERIVAALRRAGSVVGYLGDGINDATALRLADVGVSVEGAVDVAREAADVILTSPDLGRLLPAVECGRHAFENTMKYVRLTTSANFGNMISMAAASVLLPFLPMTAGQVLLNNLLSDLPALALVGDQVDRQALARPHRWQIRDIGRFMVRFGLISSVFDGLTFLVLVVAFHTGPEAFHTAWFIESLFTELAFTLVIRSRLPVWHSAPGGYLLVVMLVTACVALALPWLPLAPALGFVPLDPSLLLAMAGILVAYAATTEMAKL